MEYIPGIIHELFQKTHYYLLRSDFSWSNCNKRYSEFNEISDWDNYTTEVKLLEGDIIALKFFKYNQDISTHCYLEKVIHKNGDEEIYNKESTISFNFLEHNLDRDKSLFQSADKIINRDKNINLILNEY